MKEEDLEIMVDNEKVIVDKFQSYGFDPKYFAIKEPYLYYKPVGKENKYAILSKTYYENSKIRN